MTHPLTPEEHRWLVAELEVRRAQFNAEVAEHRGRNRRGAEAQSQADVKFVDAILEKIGGAA
jgi:hypothetical protein